MKGPTLTRTTARRAAHALVAGWFLAAMAHWPLGCHRGEPAPEATEAPAASATSCQGQALFGKPNENTGLTAEQCSPRCSCGGSAWEQPAYTDDDVEALLSWKLLDPPAPLDQDPYASASPPEPRPDEVCGMLPDPSEPRAYRLATYASASAATAAGARVTHAGACGLCSPLADLVVYMKNTDLTAPVRQCGLDHLSGPPEAHVACLEALGFDHPCAQIWYFNTIHTRAQCAAPCFAALKQPYHLDDGSLNACLQCDEDKSGPVFKAVAGRTRRNTGLANAMCRPCSEVTPLVHRY